MTAAVVEAPLDLRDAWRRWRFPIVLVVLGIGAAFGLAAVENAPPQRPLDPRDASPVGARALAELLRERGVAVTPTSTVPQDTAGTTVFVPDPQSLGLAELEQLAVASDVVVVAPTGRELGALGIDAHVTGVSNEHTVNPACSFPAADTAGDIRFSGVTYAGGSTTTGCYAIGGGAGLLAASEPGHDVVIVGSARVWTNARLGDNGDAALALGLLSARGTVSWVVPRPPTQSPADRGHHGLLTLLPARLLWTLLQLLVVVVVVALWRGRRLGPVIAEPLPVVVPSVETVRGRARLLQAARARDAAAAELRTATVRRISEVAGLGPDAGAAAVVAAVAARTGRPSGEVETLLYGPEPADDTALVALAARLDEVESTMKGRR